MSTDNHQHEQNHGHSSGGHHHILTPALCVKVGGALFALTALTVWSAGIDLGALNFPVAMAIATTKALLVVLFFMALKYDHKENSVIFGTSFVFLAIFFVLTASDIFFRGDVYVKKGELAARAAGGKSKFSKPWVATPELVAHGKTVFEQSCVSCHGPQGLGNGVAAGGFNPPPRNFTADQGWINGRKPSQIVKTLKNGARQMPAFALNSDDKWGVAHYVASLGPSVLKDSDEDLAQIGVDPTKEGAEDSASKSIPIEVAMELMAEKPSVKGDPQLVREALPAGALAHSDGKGLYESYCLSCHGEKAQGGVASRTLGVWPKVVLKTRPLNSSLASMQSQAAFNEVVLKGIPGNYMPGHSQLNATQLSSLFSYIRGN